MWTVGDILEDQVLNPVFIHQNCSVFEGLERLQEKDLGAILVVDDTDQVVGIFSERDYAREVALKGRNSKDTKIAAVATSGIVAVSFRDSPQRCLELMSIFKVRHLPVAESNGRIVGFLSVLDLISHFIQTQSEKIDELESLMSQAWPF